MTSTAIVTMAKMMETLPEPVQNQVVEHLRDNAWLLSKPFISTRPKVPYLGKTVARFG